MPTIICEGFLIPLFVSWQDLHVQLGIFGKQLAALRASAAAGMASMRAAAAHVVIMEPAPVAAPLLQVLTPWGYLLGSKAASAGTNGEKLHAAKAE